MNQVKFRSRVSVLLLLFIVIIHLSILVSENFSTTSYLINACILLFVILVFFGIHYSIIDKKLISKLWFITLYETNIDKIEKIERSYNPISSPSASLKRLELTIKTTSVSRRYVLISPVKEKSFLELLRNINPDIIIEVNDKKNIFRFWDWDL